VTIGVATEQTTRQVPLVNYLALDGDKPHLLGWECGDCGAVVLDRRVACPSCRAVTFAQRPLADTGVVRAFTIVFRAPPSVPTPFTAVIVDLDGGGVVKANLVGEDADPTIDRTGMRVRLTTYPLGVDSTGVEAVGFGFTAEEGPS